MPPLEPLDAAQDRKDRDQNGDTDAGQNDKALRVGPPQRGRVGTVKEGRVVTGRAVS